MLRDSGSVGKPPDSQWTNASSNLERRIFLIITNIFDFFSVEFIQVRVLSLIDVIYKRLSVEQKFLSEYSMYFRGFIMKNNLFNNDNQWRSQDLAQGEGKSLSVITDKNQEL